MSLKIITDVAVKPGASQTQEEAEAEFVQLFREYLTSKDGAFQADYGPDPWGGYSGPTVTAVAVLGPDEPTQTGDSGSGNERKSPFVL